MHAFKDRENIDDLNICAYYIVMKLSSENIH